MVLNSHEKLKKISFKKEDLISKITDKNHPVRYVDNEDIGFGELLDTEKKYIEYGSNLRAPKLVRRPTFPELHIDDRILLSRSKKGHAAALTDNEVIVSDNTIILKRWSSLVGVENRAISTKAKLSKVNSTIKIPKGVSERVLLEELSELITEKLVIGILISDFFINWITNDKRHKHVIVPDVISEMPIPILKKKFAQSKKFRYDLGFQTQIQKIEKQNCDVRFDEVIFHIVNLVDLVSSSIKTSTPNPLQRGYLNKLVELLYEPVTSNTSSKSFELKSIINAVISELDLSDRTEKTS